MKCIQIRHLSKDCGLTRSQIIAADMLRILDGLIGVFSLGYVSSTFGLEMSRRQLKALLNNDFKRGDNNV